MELLLPQVDGEINISEILTEQKIVPDIIRGPARELLQVLLYQFLFRKIHSSVKMIQFCFINH